MLTVPVCSSVEEPPNPTQKAATEFSSSEQIALGCTQSPFTSVNPPPLATASYPAYISLGRVMVIGAGKRRFITSIASSEGVGVGVGVGVAVGIGVGEGVGVGVGAGVGVAVGTGVGVTVGLGVGLGVG
jgi:hypothetical protein